MALLIPARGVSDRHIRATSIPSRGGLLSLTDEASYIAGRDGQRHLPRFHDLLLTHTALRIIMATAYRVLEFIVAYYVKRGGREKWLDVAGFLELSGGSLNCSPQFVAALFIVAQTSKPLEALNPTQHRHPPA